MQDDDHKEDGHTFILKGADIIASHVKTLPLSPGVYRMMTEKGNVLYVGKAKSLKKRVASYTQITKLPVRLQRMVSQTHHMEFVTTLSEAEALLLEANLIKKFQPKYNILLRDDKSFPYILIRSDHDFPQILKHRGVKNIEGQYFGPFAGAGDVNNTISILQRVFMLRNCTDSYFSQRERPCLQYHIKRCTAPCVGKVSKEEYAEQVAGAQDFMEGKSRAVQDRLTAAMQEYSTGMDYEKAAQIRDRVRALASIQSRQDINIDVGDVDALGLYQNAGKSCVQVFFYRGGRNLGNRSYFPRHDKDDAPEEILAAFMAQFYQNKPVPKEIIVSHDMQDRTLLEEAFCKKTGHNVSIMRPLRGKRKRLLDFVLRNAEESLKRNEAHTTGQEKLLAGVAKIFEMEEPPRRIEIYDNSHISGTNMVAGMVVAGVEGFQKNAYRKFNIKQATQGDDYGMMREVMSRRFRKAMDAGEDESWPDLVLIDGGQGQYNACAEILEEYGILDRFTLVAIAKGEDRNAGREKFFMKNRTEFQLPHNDVVLHYLQRLRDEAHRFAIGSHRARRQKQITSSPLDEIEGIGSKRKKALLLYFGSAKAVAGARVEDLEKVEGISQAIAQKIHDHFHGQG